MLHLHSAANQQVVCINKRGLAVKACTANEDSPAVQVNSSDVRDLVAAIDRKGFGSITYDDFEVVMARSMLQSASPAEDTTDLSSTVRLPPDSGSMAFHEVCPLQLGLHTLYLQ